MIPRGWLLRGSSPRDYAVATPAPGRVALRSRVDAPRGFGTVMQAVKADALRGKRLRFAATVGARGVRGWCGLWMRVDGARTEVLAFDNMRDRALAGDVAVTDADAVLPAGPVNLDLAE